MGGETEGVRNLKREVTLPRVVTLCYGLGRRSEFLSDLCTAEHAGSWEMSALLKLKEGAFSRMRCPRTGTVVDRSSSRPLMRKVSWRLREFGLWKA